ncbi:LacI family DNA-binding transcriptional regulator [Nocardiopsis sediminis]|uniref:LacI family DNA-binding transcriptional regulator n=1 Tax=Nocardiopsis sediminis TaxID=1778267 RepID=A0ABV8FT47_9ACTN
MARRASQRRTTAADIANEVGVSRATVGFVLNETPGQKISEATRSRVLDAAVRLGYRPHRAAQALASGQSRIILFVLPDWPVDYSMRRYLEEASLLLDEAGYSLVTSTPHPSGQAHPLWESLNPDVVVGFSSFGPEDVASMRANGVGRIIPSPEEEPASFRGSPALTTGPRLQVEHLHGLGHRSLAFAAAPDPRIAAIVAERARAAQEAARRLGLEPLEVRPVAHDDERAGSVIAQWRATGVTGIVAYNDDTAAATVSAAIRAGVSVPGDLAVVGHDDSPLAAVFLPSISSVRLDTAGLGRYLAQWVLDEVGGLSRPHGHLDVDATVVRREST